MKTRSQQQHMSLKAMNAQELLSKLVSLRSEFPNEAEIGEFLFSYLSSLGFRVQKQTSLTNKNRFNVLAEKGEGPALLFYSHMDTVPPSDEWDSPYSPRIKDGNLIGLGAIDMKAGITAILKAVENFEPQGFKLKIVFGFDEENISEGSEILMNSRYLDDVKACIVPETGISYDMPQRIGDICLGRRGRATIQIKVRGKSAHGAMPEHGINAVEDASRIVLALNELQLTEHPQLGKGSLCVRSLVSDAVSVSVPETATIIIDRHFVNPETTKSVVQEARAIIEGLSLRSQVEVSLMPRPTSYMDPYVTDENNPFVQMITSVVSQKHEIKYVYGMSVADENRFGQQFPVVVFVPEGGNFHMADEWVNLESLYEYISILRDILLRYS